ncbi:hypothetical protein SJAG_00410 [Schizosaccharomyces japonicus yFS275]|uniref:Zinc finger C2H2 LYAR-type domain-containing protein n=1 Tax=Schizosaccharomyces japonicus (strain yFS275 / FY16936) TaxID=402676 RepID=B6JVJ7_SCHJY|nr:hypothetical protein SJAG_00410 [Schizosaccharomyces japonicus yFS275]EEB05398.1 hypothetical protein SJAG_00410 [Schizosaccharomyces japonicus yFS275]
MVSFSCEVCADIVKKPKLDQHVSRCRGAYFTCIDCNTTFQGTEYRAHSSCMTEAQRYQKSLYRPTKKEAKKLAAQKQQETGTTNSNTQKRKAESEKENSAPASEKESKKSKKDDDSNKTDKPEKSSKDSKLSSRFAELCSESDVSLYKLLKKLNKKDKDGKKIDSKTVLEQLVAKKDSKGQLVISFAK